MKTRILNTIGILALAAATIGTANAQTVPNTFSYQAVITADDGTPVGNHEIAVEVSIMRGNDCENGSCPVLWQELHSATTNNFGSFSIEIGDKDAINTTGGSLSKYSDIDWLDTKDGYYYMRVRADFGKASYLNGMTDLGITKFTAVPYTLAAQTADFAKSIATDDKGKIANQLGQLSDVTIKDAQPNQLLVFDGTTWKNTSPAAAQGLTNINIDAPKTGDILVYDENVSKWHNETPKTVTFAGLPDVKLKTVINSGDVLTYNTTGNYWENQTLSLNFLNGVSVRNAQKGQVLTFSADGIWEPKDPAASSGVTKISELTGDVKLTDLKPGQILQYTDNKKWENKDKDADNIWLSGKTSSYTYASTNTRYSRIGIGTSTPSTLLDLSDGDTHTLFNAKGITVGGNADRVKRSASIALSDGEEGDVDGTAVIAGRGSKTIGQYVMNSIIMGQYSEGRASCGIVIGDNSKNTSDNCALFGDYLETGARFQYIFGQYNSYTSDKTFIVANGTDESERKNIFTIDYDGNVNATGTISGSSDARLKTNINTMTGSLGNILKLRGVTFNWKESSNPTKTQYGFIAQEVEKVFPDLVGTDSNGYKTVNYIGVIPVLTEAIKTQQEEIESLKSENEQLKSTLEQLLKRVEALENR